MFSNLARQILLEDNVLILVALNTGWLWFIRVLSFYEDGNEYVRSRFNNKSNNNNNDNIYNSNNNSNKNISAVSRRISPTMVTTHSPLQDQHEVYIT